MSANVTALDIKGVYLHSGEPIAAERLPFAVMRVPHGQRPRVYVPPRAQGAAGAAS